MKRGNLLMLSLAAALGFSSSVIADDVDVEVVENIVTNKAPRVVRVIVVTSDGKKREIKVDDGKVDTKSLQQLPKRVRVQIEKSTRNTPTTQRKTGRAVIVGPDGKKHEFKFNDGKLDPKVLKDVPKDVRERLELMFKAQPGKGINQTVKKNRAVIIGPDGKKREFEFESRTNDKNIFELKTLPDDVRKRFGTIIGDVNKNRSANVRVFNGKNGETITIQTLGRGVVVGPNGKKRLFELKNRDIDVNIESSLKNLPAGVRAEIRRAIANSQPRKPANTVKGSGDKLDLILKRLDHLQQQIDELSKKAGKK